MRRSIATVSLSGTLGEKLRAAAAAGFDGVELFESDLVGCPWSPEAVHAQVEDLGLTIDLYQPFRDFEAVPGEVFERNLRRARRKLDLMDRMGASTMLVCSNCSPLAIDDDGLAAAQLRELAQVAAERGMRIAYEALAWGRHVDDSLHAWRIVAAADHPHLGLCLDSFHVLSRGADSAGLRAIPGDRIFFLQLADAPRLPMDVLQWSRHHRCFPGQGDLDVTTLVEHVLAAGYRGPLSLEVFNDVFRQTDPRRAAVDGMRSLLALEESLWRGPGHARARGDVELAGYAFVEIAVDRASSTPAAALLRSLGFRRAARHRTKPVQLWRQAGVRVLLNAGEMRLAGQLGGDAVVAALGIESSDVDRSVRRARALLAPVRPRVHGPGEAELTEIAAPDGTAVFFCGAGAGDPANWVGDFRPLRSRGQAPAMGLTRIDHVALSQPFGYFDEAALFYRTVLGLRPLDGQELAGPDGLLRSRALGWASGEVRIALDVPLMGGVATHPSALHHVAFACEDVFAAARSARALGAPILAIPGNYYDDLGARFDLGADLLATMREHGVLYDRDEAGGELFHFYTETVGRTLFFEVVQRLGGYGGLGAVNAAVRMAAQRERMASPRPTRQERRHRSSAASTPPGPDR
jgi:4-hydroxyphenylpyruvate dioxygenase